jgi:all-trans-retinol 13,14-reductase
VIEKAGGTVLFYADVKQIIVQNNEALGVEMADGKKIYADRVISDAGVVNTYNSLLPEETIAKHGLRDLLKNLEPSGAHMGMYLGLNESAADLKLPACNYWVFPAEYNHEVSQSRYQSITDELPVGYISFPAAKDPAWKLKHPGKSTVEIIIIVPYAWFAKWEGTMSKKRGEEYDTLKQKVSEQRLEMLYRVEPQLKGKIEYSEVSSPLSTKKYTNHQHGEIYGTSHTPKRFRQDFLKPYTPVKNLFLTGQDTMIASIAGGLMGSVLCASAILKRDVLSQIKKKIV